MTYTYRVALRFDQVQRPKRAGVELHVLVQVVGPEAVGVVVRMIPE